MLASMRAVRPTIGVKFKVPTSIYGLNVSKSLFLFNIYTYIIIVGILRVNNIPKRILGFYFFDSNKIIRRLIVIMFDFCKSLLNTHLSMYNQNKTAEKSSLSFSSCYVRVVFFFPVKKNKFFSLCNAAGGNDYRIDFWEFC